MASGRIKIFRHEYDVVEGRRKETEPTLFYQCWCEIGALYGNELYKALEIRLEDTIVFEVRYCEKIKEVAAHMKDYFIEYGGDRYGIFARDFRKNEKTYVQLKANRTA